MDNQALYDRIEAYLRRELSERERAAFEAEIQNNPKMAKQLTAQRLEHQLMEVLVEDDLMSKMLLWQQSEVEEEKPEAKTVVLQPRAKRPLQRRSSVLALAAAIALLVVALFWWNRPTNQINIVDIDDADTSKVNTPIIEEIAPPEEVIVQEEEIKEQEEEQKEVIPEDQLPTESKEVIAQEDTPKEKIPSPVEEAPDIDYGAIAAAFSEPVAYVDFRGTVRGGDNTLDQALDSLEANKLAQGIAILEQLKAANEQDMDATFYLGLSYFKEGQYEKAISYLKPIAESTYLLNETAQWQLGLSYLQSGKIEEGKAAIEAIATDVGHTFEEAAKGVLEAMKGE